MTNDERREFEIGDSFFTQNWVTAPASTDARDGLGPTFNAQACSSCHLRDGRGTPASTGDGDLGLLLRISIPDPAGTGPEHLCRIRSTAISCRIGPTSACRRRASWWSPTPRRPGEYGDGTPYSLRTPTYTVESPAFGPLGDDVMFSPRLAPQVIGMGLLEAIPEDVIVDASDPDDGDGDGISGRPNRVVNPRTGDIELGRFGWKANVATVEAQSAGAFNGDVGITSTLLPETTCTPAQDVCAAEPDGGDPEVTDDRLGSVVFYSRTLAVPAMRDAGDDEVRDGAEAFATFGCAACHTSTFTTGDTDIAALSDQEIHPYTDLLLHDMGPGLADGRPDFEASGSEWRTPPLWGIGLIEDVGGARFLLHDGRARSIEEAILWHGGEAEASREAFRRADADVRAAIVAFLEAL